MGNGEGRMGNGEGRISTLLKNSSSGIREMHLIVETLFLFAQSCDRIKSILVSKPAFRLMQLISNLQSKLVYAD